MNIFEGGKVFIKGRVVWSGYELGFLCSCGRCYPIRGMFNRQPLPELCHVCGTLRQNMQKRALAVTKIKQGWWRWAKYNFVFSSGFLIDQSYPMPQRRQAKRPKNNGKVIPIRAKEAGNP